MRILLVLLLFTGFHDAIGQKRELRRDIMLGLNSNRYFTTELKGRLISTPKDSYNLLANPNDTNLSKPYSMGFIMDAGFENNYSRNNFLIAPKWSLKGFFVNKYPLINAGPEFLLYSDWKGTQNRFLVKLRAGLTLFGVVDLDYGYTIYGPGNIDKTNFTRHSVNFCFSLNAVKTIIIDP